MRTHKDIITTAVFSLFLGTCTEITSAAFLPQSFTITGTKCYTTVTTIRNNAPCIAVDGMSKKGRNTVLFSSNGESNETGDKTTTTTSQASSSVAANDDEPSPTTITTNVAPSTTTSPPPPSSSAKSSSSIDQTTTQQGADYPLNVPSPLLLASSMILAIASIGSLFELFGDRTALQFGFGPTVAIAAIGLPSCLFLFYASILKAQAETEEDDAAYRRGR